MTTQNKRLTIILISAAIILSIPFIAMQFSDQVDWSSSDFIIMGILLFSTGITCELVIRNVNKTRHRIVLILTILAAFFLIWAELAVGIFGTPFAGS